MTFKIKDLKKKSCNCKTKSKLGDIKLLLRNKVATVINEVTTGIYNLIIVSYKVTEIRRKVAIARYKVTIGRNIIIIARYKVTKVGET